MTLTFIDHLSPNCDKRPQEAEIDILVFHYTGLKTLKEALDHLINPMAKVSAHYLISEGGEIYCLVREVDRAWHAGVSYWRGKTDVNAHSIGIELENPGHEFGYRRFPKPQIKALTELCHDILSRHPIPARNIIGHSDIAPRRKHDPGELFDWKFLANQGIGLWPDLNTGAYPIESPDGLLSSLGYEVDDINATLSAFQRHYLPSSISGKADSKTCKALKALAELVGQGDINEIPNNGTCSFGRLLNSEKLMECFT